MRDDPRDLRLCPRCRRRLSRCMCWQTVPNWRPTVAQFREAISYVEALLEPSGLAVLYGLSELTVKPLGPVAVLSGPLPGLIVTSYGQLAQVAGVPAERLGRQLLGLHVLGWIGGGSLVAGPTAAGRVPLVVVPMIPTHLLSWPESVL